MGREVRPGRSLVVRRVARAVLWAGGGGHRCCVRGLVMGFPLLATGGGVRGRARRRVAGAVGACRCLPAASRSS